MPMPSSCTVSTLEIGPERGRSGVLIVEANHFIEGRAATASHLPESRDPRLDFDDTARVPRFVLVHFVLNRRSRSDERHVPAQHVPQLRQLVEARSAKK